jgi:hypothetical protein
LRLSWLAVRYVFLLGFTEDGDRLAPAMVLALSGLQHIACDDFKICDLKRQFNGAERRRFYSLPGLQLPHRRAAT